MARATADVVHFRASGVSLAIAVGDGRLPRIVHWGADLGDLGADELATLAEGSAAPRADDDAHHAVSVLPEHSWGWMHTPGLAGHRDGRDHSTRFTLIDVAVEEEGERERAVRRLVARAADAIADLTLTIVIEMLASGLVRSRATVGSTGSGTGEGHAPFTVDALALVFPVPPDATELVDFADAGGGRAPHRAEFLTGVRAWESRRGKPGPESPLLVATGSPGFGYSGGEVWAAHVAWSGNVRHLAERCADGSAVIGGGELLYPGEVRLAAGDQYAAPWVYFAYGDGLDDASGRIHRHVRSRPDHPSKPRPVAVTADASIGLDALTSVADAAVEVGAELFILGDGWHKGRGAGEGGLGDWYVDKTVFPEGLVPFADYVRSLGMEFGLGFEPEMISSSSDLAREHPAWIAQASLAGASLRLPMERGRQQVLDLTQPDAYAFVEERLHALVAELRPAHLTWRHDRDLLEAGSTATGRAIGHAQTRAHYRLADSLRAAFPGLEIEMRATGGRVDLEALDHSQEIGSSGGAASAARLPFSVGLLLPPEAVRVDAAASPDATADAWGTAASVAIWGHLGVTSHPAGDDARAALRAWIEAHKRHRRLLHSGVAVRMDPAAGLLVHGVVSQDRREALYSCVALAGDARARAIRLAGLDPARSYRITDGGPTVNSDDDPSWRAEGTTVTGRALASHGIAAPRMRAGEAVLVRAVRV